MKLALRTKALLSVPRCTGPLLLIARMAAASSVLVELPENPPMGV